MANVVTYFGEVVTKGNTTTSGNLTVLGESSLFSSNIGSKVDRGSNIGQQSAQFGNIYGILSNTTTVNVASISAPLALCTQSASNTTVYVPGNIFVANSFTTANLNTSTINVGSTLNVSSVTFPGSGLGINGTNAGTTTLYNYGNMFSTATVATTNIIATMTMNAVSSNAGTSLVVASNVGIGTRPVVGGPVMAVEGNIHVSNSISLPNSVYALTVNAATTNTNSISNASGFIQVGTTVQSGTTLYVSGDFKSTASSNGALTIAGTQFVGTGLSNTLTATVQSSVGIGTVPGSTLDVKGNVYMTANFSTTNLISTTSNISGTSNATTIIVLNSIGVGGANVNVSGNMFLSNSMSTTTLYADTVNSVSLNTSSIYGPFAVNAQGPLGYISYISGNLYVQNAFTTTSNITSTTVNVSSISNGVSFVVTANVGIGTAPVVGGPTLDVRGNATVSNSVSMTNSVYATTANADSTNTSSITNSTGFVGISTSSASGTTLYIPGNTYVTNSLYVVTLSSQRSNISGTSNGVSFVVTANVGIGTAPVVGGPTLDVQGNATVSNSISMTNSVYATTANAGSTNTSSITNSTGFVGISTSSASGTTLYISGNTYVTNSLSTTIVVATTMNAKTIVNTSFLAFNGQSIGIAAAASGNALEISGNAFVANTVSVPNVYATLANVGTMNIASILGKNSFIGIGTTDPAGTSLFLPGNSYVSNSLTTDKIYAKTVSANGVGIALTLTASNAFIGTYVPSGYTLQVTGNIYAANAITIAANTELTTVNVISTVTSTNVVGASKLSISVGAGQSSVALTRNVYASNAVTASNVIVSLANTSTLNTLSIFTQNGSVGFNGAPPFLFANFGFNNTLNDESGLGGVTTSSTPSTVSYLPTDGPFGGRAALITIPGTGTTLSTYTINKPLDVAVGVSISFWFKFVGPVVTSGNQRLVDLYGPGGSPQNLWMRVNTLSTVVASYNNVGGAAVDTPNLAAYLKSSGWNHVVLTVSAVSQTLFMYLNGQAASVSVGAAAGTFINGGFGMGRGAGILQSTEYSDVCIFNKSLNSTQVNNLYTNLIDYSVSIYSGTFIYGNLYVSNTFTGNITTPLLNTTTLNATSVATQVVLVDSLGWSNTNIYFSNSITSTNIFTTNVLASQYVGSGGSLGINMAPGGATLQVKGNLALSNTLSSLPDVSASTSLYYVDDITKRSPHLLPTPSNAAAIQGWISATCNAVSQPTNSYWSASPLPVFGNVAPGPLGLGDYNGSVLLPDGRVLFVPFSAPNIGFFNPDTREFSAVTPLGLPQLNYKFSGGVLTPSGNIVFVPSYSANIGIFNPVTSMYSNGPAVSAPGLNSFIGGVLAPNGNVIFSPYASANVGVYNPVNGVYSNISAPGRTGSAGSVLLPNGNVIFVPYGSGTVGVFNTVTLGFTTAGSVQIGSGSFTGGVLVPNGNVVFIPSYSGSNVGIFNPVTVTYANAAPHNCGASPFWGGCLTPSGKVIMAPYNSSNVGMFDPISLAYTNCAAVSTSAAKFQGCSLLTSGQVVFAPSSAASVGILNMEIPASREFCLSPYFNKF